MNCCTSTGFLSILLLASLCATGLAADAEITVSGELKQWHKVTLEIDGPEAAETGRDLNPFTDYRLTVRFAHQSGTPTYDVPGYFAADGNAANSSATSGSTWRAHVSPDKPGQWSYEVRMVTGSGVATGDAEGEKVSGVDGQKGRFEIEPTDKSGRDFRGHGRLQYVGRHHLQFAGSGEYFLKAGPDAPETLLAYRDFDGTETFKTPLKTWQPHERDWREGDPVWQDGKGKGLVGAISYLASEGVNCFSFLPYNAGGDGDNVWPFVSRDGPLHYDCSKLDQWQIVFDHAQARGLFLHFKLQEQEMDDDRRGHQAEEGVTVPTALDGGDLGVERKLYLRELVARFGYCLALNWNVGEENTQSAEQQRAMLDYLKQVDPYDHLRVVHSFPDQQDKVYPPLLGDASELTGASLQNPWSTAHQRTLKWVRESAAAGRPWVVCNDEQNPASLGVPADPGYEGFDGVARQNEQAYDLHDIRKHTLWGTITAGGGGVEYYFGYQLPQNDLLCEDFRSRDRSWDYCRYALEFFRDHKIPFAEMTCADEVVGNAKNDNSRYCLAQQGECYVVYLPDGGTASLDLSGLEDARFTVRWFNPRTGGDLRSSDVGEIGGGERVELGNPPADADQDWVVLIRRV